MFKLQGNFRCAESICAAANKLIQENLIRVQKCTMNQTGRYGEIRVLGEAQDDQQEAAGLVKAIMQVQEKSPSTSLAVLCRTNAIVQDIARRCEALGIAVSKREQESKPEDWLFARSLVSLLCNPDSFTLGKLYLARKLGKEQATTISYKAMSNRRSINMEALHFPARPTYFDVIQIMAREGVQADTIRAAQEMVNRLPSGSTVSDLALVMSARSAPEKMTPGITVCTIHAAKGREWDLVFLPAFEDEIIPSHRAGIDMEEERRLAYVAMTRAREGVFISHAKLVKRDQWAKTPRVATPSRFIKEAGL